MPGASFWTAAEHTALAAQKCCATALEASRSYRAARNLLQIGQGGGASNQEHAGVRAAELGAAAAAKTRQEQVQEQAAELQWDPLGFRQVVLLPCQCFAGMAL